MARVLLYREAIDAYNDNNLVLALQLMKEAATQGDPVACFEVALWYGGTDGMPTEKARSKQWLTRFEQLAQDGAYGYPVDEDASEMWYRRAFEQDHPETLYLFALRKFEDGRPTDEAIRLLKKAAEKGFDHAECVLASYMH